VNWRSITEAELLELIEAEVAVLTPARSSVWNRVRITPEKWQLSPEGDLGGEFWVVGLHDGRAIWFNDIEEGFDWSPFSERGALLEYGANQFELTHVMQQLIEAGADE